MPLPSSDSRAPGRRVAGAWAVVALLVVHLALLLDGARRDSMTFDEMAFVTSGLSEWRMGDYRLLPEAGALPVRLSGLPLALAGVPMPSLEGDAWSRSNAWTLGHRLFYESGHSPSRLVLLARLPFALLSVALALLVHAMARRLFGAQAALLSLALYAASPAMLAHGRLATADLAIALTFTLAAWLAARCLETPRAPLVLASCAATAACFVAKFSAVLLLPVIALLVVVRLAAGPRTDAAGTGARSLRARVMVVAALVAAHAAAAVLVIWLAHGMRYSAFRDATGGEVMKEGGWETITDEGELAPGIAFARAHHVLPEAWLFGFQYALHHSNERRAFALGRWSTEGWAWFFPLGLLLKTPLATLVLLLLAALAWPIAWRRRSRLTSPPVGPLARGWAVTPWGADLLAASAPLALLVVYWGFALRTPLNIGMRHLLPTLPATFVLAGSAWVLLRPLARGRALVVLLGAVAVLEGFLAHPCHVAYMNVLAGPESRRWTRLVDSNLDWGQDAYRLKRFLEDERPERAYVAWFGSSDPAGEGVPAEVLPSFQEWRTTVAQDPLLPGVYCISATQLVHAFSNFPGPWAQPYEVNWLRADALARDYVQGTAEDRARLRAERGDEYWDRLLVSFEQLREARLLSYLRHEDADTTVGRGAVLVYRLDAAELEAALHGPPRELVPRPLLPWIGDRGPARP